MNDTTTVALAAGLVAGVALLTQQSMHGQRRAGGGAALRAASSDDMLVQWREADRRKRVHRGRLAGREPSPSRVYFAPGETHRVTLPHSEAALHLRVAGKTAPVTMTRGQYPSAQIHRTGGGQYSFPIGLGEAGIGYQDQHGRYYGELDPSAPVFRARGGAVRARR